METDVLVVADDEEEGKGDVGNAPGDGRGP